MGEGEGVVGERRGRASRASRGREEECEKGGTGQRMRMRGPSGPPGPSLRPVQRCPTIPSCPSSHPCTSPAGYSPDPCLAGRIRAQTHLDVARPPVEVQVDVSDLAKVGKLVLDVLLGRLLVHAGDDDDPALDRWRGAAAAARRVGVSWRDREAGGAEWDEQRRAFWPSTLGRGPASTGVLRVGDEAATSGHEGGG